MREKKISHKHAREIATAIKGMNIEKARDYARTEFCVEIGEYKKEDMDKHNEEVELELFYRKYRHRREEREEQNE